MSGVELLLLDNGLLLDELDWLAASGFVVLVLLLASAEEMAEPSGLVPSSPPPPPQAVSKSETRVISESVLSCFDTSLSIFLT